MIQGFAAEIHQQVLVCGVCRNVEPQLGKTIEIIESIGRLFDDYRVLVYENNSTDNTPKLLSTWASKNRKVWVKSENLTKEQLEELIVNIHEDGRFFVPEQIARARNLVLNEAFKEEYAAFPYLIWVDMDFVRFPDFEGFIDTFQANREWDAVFAYGVDPLNIFWDWYAFRDKTYPLGSELLGMEWWYMPKYLSLSRDDSWYPVYSAFGGCGIYKKASIEGCRYSGLANSDLEVHSKRLIQDGIANKDAQVLKYLKFNTELQQISKIPAPCTRLSPIRDAATGIVIHDEPNALIWRMSSFVYQYPSVCEHVPFHASMIIRGHDKLYINPKLMFRYGD